MRGRGTTSKVNELNITPDFNMAWRVGDDEQILFVGERI